MLRNKIEWWSENQDGDIVNQQCIEHVRNRTWMTDSAQPLVDGDVLA